LEEELKKRTVLLLYILFFIIISLNTSIAFAYVATLSWYAPTTNADGTPLTDLAGYKVYYGTQLHNYDHKIKVGNVTTYKVPNLVGGATYYFMVTSYDKSGNESGPSNEVSTVKYMLTANKSGTGSGKVTSSPAGINCGSDCSELYSVSKIITLTATPVSGSTFKGWSVSSCSGTGTCSLTINANTTVTANFDVVRPVTVISPNGGDIIAAGSTYTIQWNATTEAVKFKLMYSVDNGLTWIPIASNVPGASYNWTIPKPWGNKKACLIKVVGYDASGVKVGAVKSDARFTIEVVKLTDPNGTGTFTSNTTHPITWTTNATKRPIAKVKLEYTKNGGLTWIPIIALKDPAYLSVGSHSYPWDVPIVEKNKTNCKVRIELRDADGNILAADASDNYFTIQP
jgi:hypothetical protein